MKKECISGDWLLRAPGKAGYEAVDLPNDYAIRADRNPSAPGGGLNGFFEGGKGRYVKYLKPEAADGEHLILDLDGAYMCASVFWNEQLLGMHPYGYTPFLVDLTENTRFSRHNKLVIETNAIQPSTRWYSGAGIYRDVFLWRGGKVRIEPWDCFVKTLAADETGATVVAEYLVSADLAAEAQLSAEIQDEAGNVVAKAQAGVPVTPDEKAPVTLRFEVKNPTLWGCETPALYTLHTTVRVAGQETDTAEVTFGIRTISADAERGFLLNGKPMKLRGGCIHHDHGVLGAAAYPAAEVRKLSRLKAAGFNALRIAHNPPSLALLEACDRMGLLVMDEAFDMWNHEKTTCDYHLWFADWWARDLSYMVLRDRNHPSVISYSIGNEIPERDGRSKGAEWAKKLADEIRKYDATRLVTSGVCGMWESPEDIDPDDYKADFYGGYPDVGAGAPNTSWAERTEGYFAPLDIAGYNYIYERYAFDRTRFPGRVIWGSETHTLNFYKSWKAVLENDHVIGDFTWTAYDNLGESGAGRFAWARDGKVEGLTNVSYPWRACFQGDLDLCGYRRPQSYFREAVWIGGTAPRIFTTHPEHYGEDFSGTGWHWHDVNETWTYPDAYLGKPVKVEVYSDADEIVFYLNGKEAGRAVPTEGIAYCDIPYEKGTLEAVAWMGGAECGRYAIHTVGAPAKVLVEPEQAQFAADGRDLCFFEITIADEKGDRVPDAKQELICLVDGGELLGIYSADPANRDRYTSNLCHAFEGRALAVVRTKTPGEVRVTVGSNGLQSGHAKVTAC